MNCIWCNEECGDFYYEIRQVDPSHKVHEGYLCKNCSNLAFFAPKLAQMVNVMREILSANVDEKYCSDMDIEKLELVGWWRRFLKVDRSLCQPNSPESFKVNWPFGLA